METTTKTKWVIDPTHSEITFKVKHLMITNVKGNFREFTADIQSDGDAWDTAVIDVRINAASVDTGVSDRDAHLRSADFFDVEHHPEIRFTGRSFEKQGDDAYVLHGDMSIRGVTRPVVLEAEYHGMMKDPWGNSKAGFTLEGKISRKDWDLNWNAALEAGGVLVSDDVRILCEVQLLKQA